MINSKRIVFKNSISYVYYDKGFTNIHVEIGSFLGVFNSSSYFYFFEKFRKKHKSYIKSSFDTISGKKVLIRITDDILISLTLQDFKETYENLKAVNKTILK